MSTIKANTISNNATSPANLTIGTTTNHSLVVQTNNTTALTIDTNQNIVIPSGKKITGDFSNATIANRVMVQTSTTNGSTVLSLIPNGSNTTTAITLESDNTLANGPLLSLAQTSTETTIQSSRRSGSGTYTPMVFYTSGLERIRIATDGNLSTANTLVMGSAYSHRNKFINGGCQVAQRGNLAVAANINQVYGGADRIYASTNGFTTITSTLKINNTNNFATWSGQYLENTTTTGTGNIYFGQKIEALNTRSITSSGPKSVTVSVRVRHEVGSNVNFYIYLYRPTSAMDTFSALTQLGVSTVFSIPSGTATTCTYTFPLSTDNAVYGLQVEFMFSGIGAVTNCNFMIGDMQLEEGTVATPFEHRSYGVELALCQRYYKPICIAGQNGQYILGGGMCANTTATYFPIKLGVPMRVAPTLEYSNVSHFIVYGGVGIATVSVLSLGSVDTNTVLIGTTNSALTNGSAALMYTNGTTAAMALKAEL